MDAYTDLVEDLQRTEPVEVPPIIPPYNEMDTFDIQFNATYGSLQRNARLKSRTLALLDAYFLGKLLNGISDQLTRLNYRQMISDHFQRMAENTFDIFEYHPEQIQRTEIADIQRIRKIPRPIIRTLREIVLSSFAGARN